MNVFGKETNNLTTLTALRASSPYDNIQGYSRIVKDLRFVNLGKA